MRKITLDICQEFRGLGRATLEFAAFDLTVDVRELTQAEVKQVYESLIGKDPNLPEVNEIAELQFCSLGIVEGDDQLFNSDAGRAALKELPYGIRKAISDKVMAITGLNSGVEKKS